MGSQHLPLLPANRKAALLLARAADSAGLPHTALLFAHDALGAPLQQQYGTVLAHRAALVQRSDGDQQVGLLVDKVTFAGA